MTCGTKIRHADRDQALAHIKQLVWKNHVAGQSERSARLAPYPCDQCGAWHVGHHESTPVAWHYTVVTYLDSILAAGALKVPRPRRWPRDILRPLRQEVRIAAKAFEEPAPLLWLSRNPDWEHSVSKTHGTDRPAGRAST